jgi:hypothetical protein
MTITEEVPAPLCSDSEWIKSVASMPRARLLMEHLAAFKASICCGGTKGIEPPVEQCATWRRVFCYEFGRTNTPFGIPLSDASKQLPKCIGMCNLSGKHAMYYSDAYKLAKVVCLSAQAVNPIVIDGINAVIAKAQEIDATILFCFCLPFQAGLERCHWEIRTVRKTSRGAVKDGELCFSTGDAEARVVPCTAPLEHWNEIVLKELVRKLMSCTSPTCLDRAESDESDVKMTSDSMERMIEMLKTDRRKMMDLHKTEIDELVKKQHLKLANSVKRAEDAEQEANTRIAKVAAASKVAEETMKKKVDHLESHNATLRQQLLAQESQAMYAKASLVGFKLEREQETKEAAARQKTLEAQVSTLKSNLAKQTSQQAKARNDQKADHEKAISALNATIADLKSSLASTNAASRAVQASSSEARTQLKDVQTCASALKVTLGSKNRELKVWKAIVSVSATRHSALKDEKHAVSKICDAQSIALKDKQSEIERLTKEKEDEVVALSEKLKGIDLEKSETDKLEIERLSKELQEANKELGCKTHLAQETEKRCKSLEKRLTESDQEVRRLSAKSPDPLAKEESPKKPGGKKGQTALQHSDEKKLGSYAHNTVNVSQNTAVFMSQPHPPHRQAFPSGQYTLDPSLENTISQLHSALNCITAMARSSSSNARQVEVAQAKLDALGVFGIGHQQTFYDPAAHGYALPGNGYGHGHCH